MWLMLKVKALSPILHFFHGMELADLKDELENNTGTRGQYVSRM
jgi:hypothetical protein